MSQMKKPTRKKKKMTYDEWVHLLSNESGVDVYLVSAVWTAFLNLIIKNTRKSESHAFFIPEFGTFSISIHKGHPLNLGLKNCTKMEDYEVFKFKPNDVYKRKVLDGNFIDTKFEERKCT